MDKLLRDLYKTDGLLVVNQRNFLAGLQVLHKLSDELNEIMEDLVEGSAAYHVYGEHLHYIDISAALLEKSLSSVLVDVKSKKEKS